MDSVKEHLKSIHGEIYDFENIDVINMTADEYYDLYIEPEILKLLDNYNFLPDVNNYEDDYFKCEYCENMSTFQEIFLVENKINIK